MRRALTFLVTYTVTTPEGWTEGGFANAWGVKVPMVRPTTTEDKDRMAMTLREAVALVGQAEDCGRWFVQPDGWTDPETNAVARLALHPHHTVTPSSYRRIGRLLGNTY